VSTYKGLIGFRDRVRDRVRVSIRVILVQLVCASTLDNNVAPSVESISNIRGHCALPKKASRKIGDSVFPKNRNRPRFSGT